jgi:tetratricopeptide (TPR) repeat protein
LHTGSSSLPGLISIVDAYAHLSSQRAIDDAAHKLGSLARHAWLSRQLNDLQEISQSILGLPLHPNIRNIGHYYSAHRLQTIRDAKQYQKAILEIVDNIVPEYQARSILALGASYNLSGDAGEAASLYLEAASAASKTNDWPTRCAALRGVAVIRSIQGDHNGALADLKRLLPIMRWVGTVYPSEYYEHLNSLAVELGETGSIDEANRAVDVALNSQFAPGYPHWQETKLELTSKPKRVFAPIVFAVGPWCRARELSSSLPVPVPVLEIARVEAQSSAQANAVRNAAVERSNRLIRPSIWQRRTHLFSENLTPSACLPVAFHTLSGYALSPPARAPPSLFPA